MPVSRPRDEVSRVSPQGHKALGHPQVIFDPRAFIT